MGMSAASLIGDELCTRQVTVRAQDVVYVKGIFEASEGLGALFAESGGELIIAVHASRLSELEQLLCDLTEEIGAIVRTNAAG